MSLSNNNGKIIFVYAFRVLTHASLFFSSPFFYLFILVAYVQHFKDGKVKLSAFFAASMLTDEPTSTPFEVTVAEGEPFSFQDVVTHNGVDSVWITHIAYHPPACAADLATYYAAHPKSHSLAATTGPSGEKMTYAVAEIEDLSIGNEPRRVVIGCFPLDLTRIPRAGSAANDSVINFSHGVSRVAPVPTDVIQNMNIVLDLDGHVNLYVRGPGEVVFYGVQQSVQLPDWEGHRLAQGEDDGEGGQMTDGELALMFSLAQD